MKVLHSALSLSRRGAGVFEAVRELTAQLQAVDTLDINATGPIDLQTAEHASLWQCPTNPYQTIGPASFGYSRQLPSIYQTFAPDIAHLHGLWMHYSVANLRHCRRNGVPYLVSPHGMLDSWALANSKWKKRIARLLFEDRHLHGATCLHALCDAEVNEIRNLGFRNPICLIPNGVTPAAAATVKPPWSDRFDSDRPVMLFLGRLHPKKGLGEFLDAWAECSDIAARANWGLAVIGWGDAAYQTGLEDKVQSLGLQNDVAFLGARFGAEKDAALLGASGFVLPSFSEGLPVAVLEAWGAAVPVLMTAECNIPQGFDAGAALQVSSDPKQMAVGLRQFLSLSSDDLTTMGAKGQDLVQRHYVWSSVSKQFVQAYRWMLGEADVPDFVV